MEKIKEVSSFDVQLATAQSALASATDDFERLQVRDAARVVYAAAAILKRRDVQVQAANLVMDAERAVVKANPPMPQQESGRMGGQRKVVHPGDDLPIVSGATPVPAIQPAEIRRLRMTHSKVSDVEFDALKQAAVETAEPLTRKALSRHAKAKARDATSARKAEKEALPRSTVCQLYHCNITELRHHVDAESVDIILTDPPYAKDAIPLWSDLAAFASYALKEGGSVLAMSGKMFLPEVFAAMDINSLRYNFMVSVEMSQTSQCMERGITVVQWKPFLWYLKGSRKRGTTLNDMYRGSGEDKQYHRWGQSVGEFQAVLERLAAPGDVVCDPFLGGGTTALAAMHRGCAFIGADIDESCLETTTARLQEVMRDAETV